MFVSKYFYNVYKKIANFGQKLVKKVNWISSELISNLLLKQYSPKFIRDSLYVIMVITNNLSTYSLRHALCNIFFFLSLLLPL